MSIADRAPRIGAARHPEKANKPDNPIKRKPARSGQGADVEDVQRNPGPDAGPVAQYRVRRGGVPQHRRVLVEEARDDDDPGLGRTRACTFNVATGRPDQLDPHEPDAGEATTSASITW